MKILIDGPGAEELEVAVREELGAPPDTEAWVLSLVKQQPTWTVNLMVPPQEHLWGWTYVGPAGELPGAIAGAVDAVGLRRRHRDS